MRIFRLNVLFSLFIVIFPLYASQEEKLEVHVTNVGQGNFVSLRLKNQQETEGGSKQEAINIIIDCGSSSHENELVHIAENTGKNKPDVLKKIIPRKRKEIFRIKSKKAPLHITAVIFTHPDKDHINEIDGLLDHLRDKIDYIICGGTPKFYEKVEQKQSFQEWLSGFLINGTKIYFPVLRYEPVKDSNELGALFSLTSLEDVELGAPRFSPQGYGPDNFDAHPFPDLIRRLYEINTDFKLYFLAANPLNIQGEEEVERENPAPSEAQAKKEANSESLVLKVQYGAQSIILTGDATGKVIERIRGNYKDEGFLESNGYLADHHGASTEGSNSEGFIKEAFKPSYVFISHGTHAAYGHPRKETLEAFRGSPRLKTVAQAHGLSWGKDRETETTQDAIFSTYESGDLTALLYKDRFELFTQAEGAIGVNSGEAEELGSPEEGDKKGKEKADDKKGKKKEKKGEAQPLGKGSGMKAAKASAKKGNASKGVAVAPKRQSQRLIAKKKEEDKKALKRKAELKKGPPKKRKTSGVSQDPKSPKEAKQSASKRGKPGTRVPQSKTKGKSKQNTPGKKGGK